MGRTTTFTILFTAAVIATAHASSGRETIEELALKNTMIGETQTHIKRPAHLSASEFKGELKYASFAQQMDEFPEIAYIEDFSLGAGNECTTALSQMIYYAFEMLNHREIYKPQNSMKDFCDAGGCAGKLGSLLLDV
ncbi:hypothetical protein FGO68_gene15447 [Halteria grandinella]|uniref:Uncharacterized protein n=1 Tax=Halteria grandinella TaxID=5974 RepID=A0A8J8P3M1_HALGN|nr:hypothetical protein FGO68_gene15447 [Halteria grandinella]